MDSDQAAYCGFVRATLLQLPAIADVVDWNEANAAASWPQQDAPAQYEALLTRCYDVLHAGRPGVNVIASTAPHAGHSATAPGTFWRRLGSAYRASGRDAPILDTFGHNAYPQTSDEQPSARHARGPIRGRPLPAARGAPRRVLPHRAAAPRRGHDECRYMEDGFQSTVAGHAGYRGSETDAHAVDPETEALRLADAVRLAACQPQVGAFFNFELLDERRLEGWRGRPSRTAARSRPTARSNRRSRTCGRGRSTARASHPRSRCAETGRMSTPRPGRRH